MPATRTRFTDRADAGHRLAARLAHLRGPGTVVVALPRGGVPVAAEVAAALAAPLDICVIRKLGLPHQPELGMGAIGEDGVRVLNEQVLRPARVTPGQLAAVEARERAELEAGPAATGATGRRSTCAGGRWSWSTTAWRPVRPRGPPV